MGQAGAGLVAVHLQWTSGIGCQPRQPSAGSPFPPKLVRPVWYSQMPIFSPLPAMLGTTCVSPRLATPPRHNWLLLCTSHGLPCGETWRGW